MKLLVNWLSSLAFLDLSLPSSLFPSFSSLSLYIYSVFTLCHGHFFITYCRVPRRMKAGETDYVLGSWISSKAFFFEWSFLLSQVYKQLFLWFCSRLWWVLPPAQCSQVLSICRSELVPLQDVCVTLTVILRGTGRVTITLTSLLGLAGSKNITLMWNANALLLLCSPPHTLITVKSKEAGNLA